MLQKIEYWTNEEKMDALPDNANNIDNWLDLLGNNIFTVTFVKHTGDHRTITGRLNCHKYTIGGEARSKVNDKTLCVFDMNKLHYRNVNIDRVIKLRCHNMKFSYSRHHVMKRNITAIVKGKVDVVTDNKAENAKLFCQP